MTSPTSSKGRNSLGGVNNNAKPNNPRPTSPDDDLADDMHNDIDVPVYRREANEPAAEEPAADEPSAGSTKIEKPSEVEDEPGAEAAPAPESAAEGKPKPAKRDIYALAGRARPQRIESRAAEPAPAESKDSDVDLTNLDAPTKSTAAGTAGAASATGAASTTAEDRWDKIDDSDVAQYPESGASDQSLPEEKRPLEAGVAPEEAERSAVAAPETAAASESTTAPETVVAPAAVGAPAAAGAQNTTETGDTVGTPTEDASATAKRGTTSFGLFVLRAALGAYLLVRGLQTLFSFGGDPGVDVFQTQLENYNFADILAIGIPVAQVVAGGLLLLGLLTPFGAALATVVAGFMAFHNLNNFQGSLWPYGMSPYIQLWVVLTVVSISLIFVGPGRISLDRSRGWATRPLASAWIFFVVAVAATAGLWLAVGGGNPFN